VFEPLGSLPPLHDKFVQGGDLLEYLFLHGTGTEGGDGIALLIGRGGGGLQPCGASAMRSPSSGWSTAGAWGLSRNAAGA